MDDLDLDGMKAEPVEMVVGLDLGYPDTEGAFGIGDEVEGISDLEGTGMVGQATTAKDSISFHLGESGRYRTDAPHGQLKNQPPFLFPFARVTGFPQSPHCHSGTRMYRIYQYSVLYERY